MKSGFKKLIIGVLVFSVLLFTYTSCYPTEVFNEVTEEDKLPHVFVGSKKSDVYHYPSCRYVKMIKPENIIWFTSVEDARNHGYRPCKVCKPP